VDASYTEPPATTAYALEREVADLYALHSAELLRYAARLLRRRRDGAADAIQESFLRYFEERKCGGSITNPRAWLRRVLHNHIRDWLSRVSNQREIAGEGVAKALDPAQNPEELLSRSQEARQIAINFTVRELECFYLRAKGFSYGEIGGILGIRTGTVGALLSRVHEKFRRATADQQEIQMRFATALLSEDLAPIFPASTAAWHVVSKVTALDERQEPTLGKNLLDSLRA
jgi:RNA polymerase sigma factor (sigma-70 family)